MTRTRWARFRSTAGRWNREQCQNNFAELASMCVTVAASSVSFDFYCADLGPQLVPAQK